MNGEFEFPDFEEYIHGEFNKQYAVRVNERVHDRAMSNTKRGELAREIRKIEWKAAFGDARGEAEQIDHEIETLEDEKDDLDAKIRELQAEREGVERRLTRLRERRKNVDTSEQKLETIMETLEDDVWDGRPVNTELSSVKKAARLAQVEPDDIIDRLKERTGAPDHAFVRPGESRFKWSPAEAARIKAELDN
ncbi:hypothetical protein SAMN05421858_5098 [Haladaptatus litoreus]|uniref:Uncharacterized protein n=1 Tax=Haladaptatus litoreus TaxID=553468 RepID=A0A1N7FIR6_9EURY|nr:hypothetical protein [Haladaptatus litoreus]SIS00135.1 hypothetical protein SAMN05421858_5098 [Haladaptatus litoreus]